MKIASGATQQSDDLLKYIGRRFNVDRPSYVNWFDCLCVRVRAEDGMSWSAEAVYQYVARYYPYFKRFCLTSNQTTDDLPAIAELVGVRRFLKAAVENGLTTSFITLRWWVAPAFIALVTVGAVAVKVFEALAKAHADATKPVSIDRMDILLWGAISICGLVLKELKSYLDTKRKSNSVAKFLEDLETKLTTRPNDVDKFIDSVASRLASAPNFPRVVIIDDYEKLDTMTRGVIERYLAKAVENRVGAELWVIFEQKDGGQFSKQFIAGRFKPVDRQIALFDQELLTGEQKRRLLEIRHRPENADAFTTVKRICEDTSEGKTRLIEIFRDHRHRHPKNNERYGSLDFLYLLSLTAAMGGHRLNQNQIVSEFASKSGFLAKVLAAFLKGTDGKKDEFRFCITQIVDAFKNTTIFTNAEGLDLTLEAAEALGECADELELPDATVGHLFWFLLYSSISTPRDKSDLREASLTRKLAYHAKSLEFSRIQDGLADLAPEEFGSLLDHVANEIQITTDDCLKACIFRDVPTLLAKTASCVERDNSADKNSRRRQKLIRQCWQAYWMLGSRDALSLILGFADMSTHPILQKSTPRRSGILEDLFFESTPSLAGQRALLEAAADRSFGGREQASSAISDYAKGQACILSFAVAPLLKLPGADLFMRALTESYATLDTLHERVWDRISGNEYLQAEILDIVTLSSTIWCAALRCDFSVLQQLLNSGAPQSDISNMWEEAGCESTEVTGAFGNKYLPAVVEMANNAVLIAYHLQTLESQQAWHGLLNFPVAGLARELCCVSLASILLAYHFRERAEIYHSPIETDLLHRISRVVSDIGTTFGASLPKITTASDLASLALFEEVDDMMRACEIMWHTFELDRLRDFTQLRRAYLASVCSTPNANKLASPSGSVDFLAILNAEGFIGLLANLMTANQLLAAAELSAYYVNKAATLALRGEFGSELTRDLAFLALANSHDFDYDLSEPLMHIFGTEEAPEPTIVTNYLRRFSEDNAVAKMLTLLQATRRTGQEELVRRCRSVVETYIANGNLSEATRREARSLLDVMSVMERLERHKSIDDVELLQEWQERKDLWTYPIVLNLLLSQSPMNSHVRKECAKLLLREVHKDVYSTYFLLALNLAWPCVQTECPDMEGSAGANYIAASIVRWQYLVSAVSNMRAYWVLALFDSNRREEYVRERSKWELVVLERDHLKRLPELLEKGKFFAVFRDYCDSMLRWGLEADTDREELYRRINLNGEHRKHAVDAWRTAGASIPSAWSARQGGRLVSAEFLSLGHWLFSPPYDKDSALDEERARFDREAQSALPMLLEMIIKLPRLPVAIGELVSNCKARFIGYTRRGERDGR